jgi:HSP20 family protein
VVHEEGRIVMRADVPGVKPEDIQIEVEGDVLTISGEHEEREEEKDERFVRRERRYGSFARSITLPKGVSAEDVAASCEEGVLEVTVPFPEQAERKAVRITPKTSKSG